MSSNVDWDSKLVLGGRAKAPVVTRKATDLNSKRSQNHGTAVADVHIAARKTGQVIATEKKTTAGSNKAHSGPDHQRIAKLDRENEVAPPPKIPPSVGKAMSQARQELGITQKDVAQKINEKPSVIQDYEAGKAIPNPQVLGKLERILKVKLRGNDIGKKLEGPKK